MRGSPDAWARKACALLDEYEGDRIIAEVNNGGDLVEKVIRTIDRSAPYTAVRASRGKIVRAEPIAALYEQGKVKHVGKLKELEEQMTSYTPTTGKSPDRLDALVWALTELSRSSGQAVWRVS
jgi:phage terminase large subunit-like protein